KHGNAGKHYSGAERSMLDGFQIAVKKIQAGDEYNLAPLFSFYDSIHEFLDGSIRRVIERCANAAATGAGIEPLDVDVLKLLYLIRYVPQDMPANLDNLVILMADNINVDPISMRKTVAESLNRLFSQNYIGRSGDTYNFLTDEEQDIWKEINAMNVDTASIVERIAHMIFADIYPTKKFQYGKYNFGFDQMVDGVTVGAITGGMRLKMLTVATDAVEKAEMRLMTESVKQAIVVLGDTPYYEFLERAMKIRKYVKQRNVSQLSKSVQDIIGKHTDEAKNLEDDALEQLRLAIAQAEYYVDGEHLTLKGSDPKAKIDQALEYLVVHVYSQLELITKNAESDDDIVMILTGMEPRDMFGNVPNQDAAAKVEKYLEIQSAKNLPTSMFDVQTRYQGIPYGWREIDVAAVVARLICDQKVTIKQAGATIRADNPKLPDMLRKKTEIGKTTISIKVMPEGPKLKAAKEFLRQYFEVMTLPEDVDSLMLWIIDQFSKQKDHYTELLGRYTGHKYPDQLLVTNGIDLIDNLLSQQKDDIALVNRLLKLQDDFINHKQKIARVENFFMSQQPVFDTATQLTQDLSHELDYLSKEEEANQALNKIRLITMIPTNGPYNYERIKELHSLMATVHEGHDRLLNDKRDELLEIVRQCMEAIHRGAKDQYDLKSVIQTADTFYDQKKQQIAQYKSLALLDGLVPPMIQYKDQTMTKIEAMTHPKPVTPPIKEPDGTGSDTKPVKPVPKKVIKQLNRMVLFPQKTLEDVDDVDAYLAQIKKTLLTMMQGCDGIKLN
ncbi:MAG TPA: BREX system P-loop protein BrxC, partial [Lachnospiraceae bacterium]|nr:BREX system P-loop protein BrxC [Lachnospiraceae bacterium]